MRNLLKKIAKSSTEKAFTAASIFQPKMPKAIQKEIDKKKD